MEQIKALVTDVPDFPKPGILFRDITPVLENPEGLKAVVDGLAARYEDRGITHFVGIESRGFIFASALAYRLGAGVVLIRKPGKLPRDTYSASYTLEYGEDSIEIHQDAVGSADRVVLVDDLIATGGTAQAAIQLLRQCGASIEEMAVVIELEALHGRQLLDSIPLHALLKY